MPDRHEKVPDLTQLGRVLNEVTQLSPTAVVQELVQTLGAQLVAAIAGVADTREVRTWEAGRPPERLESLRAALQATRVIVATSANATARVWFVGSSSRLDFVSPLEVIRENSAEARERVVRAAFSFATQ
jgi:hypothetical protein